MDATIDTPVTLTPLAVEKVKAFQRDNTEGVLRLGVRGGGCSGFQYALALDHPHEEDFVYTQADIKIAIDPASIAYLKGATLHYKEGLEESGFAFENPNATSACGCGSSFRMDAQAGCDSAVDGEFESAL